MPYLTWLADACRDTGYPVVEVPGWRTRGHGPMTAAHGVVGHWTAGPAQSPKTGDAPSLQVVDDGRPGLDGPLCNVYTAFDGTLYVVAAGKAYHAGVSAWHGETDLNGTFVGNEVESPGAFIYTDAQLDVTPRLHAALLNRMGNDESWSCAHFECAEPPGRKPDGPARDMDAFRAQVGGYLADPSTIRKPPAEADPLEEIMALYDSAAAYEAALRRVTAAGVRDALKDYLPRMVQAADGRANSVFNGDFVAQTPAQVLDLLTAIAKNTTPQQPAPEPTPEA